METEFVLSLGDQRWPLPPTATTVTIGRASNADIRLQADDQISRIHARLTRESTTWTLHDASRNGTGLNGHRLTAPTPLNPGDRIHIGRSILTFHTIPQSPTTPPPAPPTHAAPAPAAAAPAASASGPAAASVAALSGPAASPAEPAPSGAFPAQTDDNPPVHAGGHPFSTDTPASQPSLHADDHPAGDPSDAPPNDHSAGAQTNSPFTPTGSPANERSGVPADDYPAGGYTAHAPGGNPFAAGGSAAGERSGVPADSYPMEAGGDGSGVHAGVYPAGDADENPFTAGGAAAADGSAERAGDYPAGGYPAHAPGDNPLTAGGSAAGDGSAVRADDYPAGGYPAHAAGGNPFAAGGAASADGSGVRADDYPGYDAGGEGSAGGYSAGEAGGNPFAAGGSAVGEGSGVPADGYSAGDEVGHGPVGLVPGFEGRDGAPWAAYPSADNPEPVRSPWEVSGQIDQSESNWNESDSWPGPTDRRAPAGDRRGDGFANQQVEGQQAGGLQAGQEAEGDLPGQELGGRSGQEADGRSPGRGVRQGDGDPEAVGTVRLPRVLVVAGGIVVVGLVVNLVASFFSTGPGGMLRWLIAPSIALVAGMVLALIDAAAPKPQRPGRFDVSVLIAIGVVLVGIGVGGFALTAGTEYVAGYLTGNESGADRLVKPVAKSGSGITVTVENVTYTSHFTRIEVQVANRGKQAFSIPIDGTTFTAADGTALRADPGKSSWPSRIDAGGSEHGTITFKGKLPDSATQAALTFKSGSTTFTVSGVTLSK
ncbi:FHA domain-containing protein [Kribbella sp. WER1]